MCFKNGTTQNLRWWLFYMRGGPSREKSTCLRRRPEPLAPSPAPGPLAPLSCLPAPGLWLFYLVCQSLGLCQRPGPCLVFLPRQTTTINEEIVKEVREEVVGEIVQQIVEEVPFFWRGHFKSSNRNFLNTVPYALSMHLRITTTAGHWRLTVIYVSSERSLDGIILSVLIWFPAS